MVFKDFKLSSMYTKYCCFPPKKQTSMDPWPVTRWGIVQFEVNDLKLRVQDEYSILKSLHPLQRYYMCDYVGLLPAHEIEKLDFHQ